MNTLDTIDRRYGQGLAKTALESDLAVSALNVRMLASYASAAAILNPVAYAFGASLTGSADFLSEQTGGVALKVDQPEGLGSALDAVVEAFASRYTLGFPLNAQDQSDDGIRKVKVEVRRRNVTVSFRKGFSTK